MAGWWHALGGWLGVSNSRAAPSEYEHEAINSSDSASGTPSAAPAKPSRTETAGSARRLDDKVSYGFSAMKGKRAKMEDTYCAEFRQLEAGGEVGVFGVFDGHGGPHAADFVKKNLFNSLLASAKFPADTPGALVEAFEATDEQYLKSGTRSRDDGCTAITAVLAGQRLTVAHVGDSRCVLCRDGKALPLSEDHKPNRADERQRIEEAGGVVVWAGTWRVGGVLAVSRAFGDRLLKRYVVATPDVREEELGADDSFLIMASDGLWDVFTNEDAVDFVKATQEPGEAAKALMDEAFKRGSADNISCIVLRFAF